MLGRPSSLNSNSLPKFVFDANLSPCLARGLEAFGEDASHLMDFFGEGVEDVEWLEWAGRNGICVITRDLKVVKRPIELEALKIHGVGAFFLGGKKITQWQMIQQIVKA